MKSVHSLGDDGLRVERRQLSANYPWSVILPKPPSVNAMYGQAPGHRRYMMPEYKAWLATVDELLKKVELPIYKGEVWVSITIEDVGTGDLDNRAKALLDLLVKKSVIVDDSRKYVRGVYLEWGNVPGCRVEVSPFHRTSSATVPQKPLRVIVDNTRVEVERVFGKAA